MNTRPVFHSVWGRDRGSVWYPLIPTKGHRRQRSVIVIDHRSKVFEMPRQCGYLRVRWTGCHAGNPSTNRKEAGLRSLKVEWVGETPIGRRDP